MGLAGAKNKRKWAKDPNNTAWSRNTDTFGQKILRQQGWQPGQYLGAQDAQQSEFYTAANASHIRAVLKDDNLGLGARRGGGDECTGLDAFQELLGRLNGKSEESLEEARRKREHVRMNQYLHRKLGMMRFVYGGLLVGDQVQELADELKREKEAAEGKEKKSKKKSKSDKGEEEEEDGESASGRKKSKKRKVDADDDTDEAKARRKEKKEKRKREKEANDGTNENDADEADSISQKKSKKDRKEKRKKSKNEDDEENYVEATDSQSKKKKKKRKTDDAGSSSSDIATPLSTELTTPTVSGTSTPVTEVPHRHLARKRFIAQKRAAVMDPAALNQIFMIKT